MSQASGGARRTGVRSTLGAVLAGLLAVVVWWFQSSDEPSEPQESPTAGASAAVMPGSATAESSAPKPSAPTTSAPKPSAPKPSAPSRTAQAQVDEHGLPYVDAATLPDPAGEILVAIDNGGPFEYVTKDGSTFGNYEGVLPRERRGYYREYTVETPGLSHRGARRIVTGSGGEFYWTDDHYSSFERIRR